MQPWEQLRLRSGRAGGEDGGDSPPHPSARPQLPGAAPAEPPRPAPDSPSVSARSQSGAEAPSSSESSSEGAARAPPAGPMAPALGGAGKAQLPHFPPAPFSSSPLPPPSSPSGWGGSGASPRSRGAGRPPPGILPLAGVSAEAEKGPCGAAAGPVPCRWPGCSAAASRLPGLGLGVERGNGRRGSATIPIGLPLGVSPPPAVDRGAGAAPPPPPLASPSAVLPPTAALGAAPGSRRFPKALQPLASPASPRSWRATYMPTHIYTRARICEYVLEETGLFCRSQADSQASLPLPRREGARASRRVCAREDTSGAGRSRLPRPAPSAQLGSRSGFSVLPAGLQAVWLACASVVCFNYGRN